MAAHRQTRDPAIRPNAVIELSEKVYNKTLIKYKSGVASSMDVTQANSQFLERNSAYSTAIIEMLNAKTALEKALNNL